MIASWFRVESFYENTEDKCVFYPSLYARGYRFAPEDQAKMNNALGPFLNGRLRVEFIATFLLVSTALMVAAAGYLFTASTEELDAILATPPWVWLVVAIVMAGVIMLPTMLRLRSKIRRQLDETGVEANEPARPDFFIVDGAFSPTRLSYAIAFVAVLLLGVYGLMMV